MRIVTARNDDGVTGTASRLNPQLEIVVIESSFGIDEMDVRFLDASRAEEVGSRDMKDDALHR